MRDGQPGGAGEDGAANGGQQLAVSVVVHHWRADELHTAVGSLGRSLHQARQQGLLAGAQLFIVYNGPAELDVPARSQELAGLFPYPLEITQVQANGGYGRANNTLLRRIAGQAFDAALVMNPDVAVDEQAVARLLLQLAQNPGCGLVVPQLLDMATGEDAHGCKRYPSIAVLATRQFAFLRRFPSLLQLNDRYEYRDWPQEQMLRGVELCSGCFLLARMDFWRALGGFDERYFMYFEDFDLSRRGALQGWEHIHEPAAVVRHAGGGAARKPLRHRIWFVRSAFRFFMSHGWRWWRVGKPLS